MSSDVVVDAAPLGSARHSVVSVGNSVCSARNRKRGPRPVSALQRRMFDSRGDDTPPDMMPGESGIPISGDIIDTQPFCFYDINIRCLLNHLSKIQFHLDVHKPHVVFFQETWLCKKTEVVQILGYRELSRKVRVETENRGA